MAVWDWQAVFAEALPYDDFLVRHGTPEQRQRWAAVEARLRLTAAQQALLAGFTRAMPVLCLAGAWCGDCVSQVPILRHVAAASAVIHLRLLDREANPGLRDALAINGGHRVPVVAFLSEDWQLCSVYGDRVLALYRQMARDRLGPACPTGIVPPGDNLLAAATAEWLAEFERIQLLLRLTGRLRERHGD